MLYDLKKIQDAQVKGKKVFLRADLDVPIENATIKDASRLRAWFPTLEHLLKNGAMVYLCGHMGRPEGVDEKLSLRPVAEWVNNKLELGHIGLEEKQVNGFKAFATKGNVTILENLRFYKEEEANDDNFSQKLAELAEIYVNDAFASDHRAHASIVGVPKYLPHFAGLRVQIETEELSNVLENPKRPLAFIIGGAKIETKLPLVEKMHQLADYVLVGGEIAENDKILLKVQHEKLEGTRSVLLVADLIESTKDITEKSAENFLQVLQNVASVVWNGPMGLVEEEEFAKGTRILADGVTKLSAYKILGGGDTVSCIDNMKLLDKFDFVSIGGGAMLEFLAGVKLPGLVVLEN